MAKAVKSTYQYIQQNSILNSFYDEYELSEKEYVILYSFFVTYSMCKNQSGKGRDLVEYGWSENDINKSGLKKIWQSVLDLDRGAAFYFFGSGQKALSELFQAANLCDGKLTDIDTERCVIGKNSEPNKYFKLFRHIRNGLAHGNFRLIYNSHRQKMVIIQDDDSHNVTARIVLKLDTLLKLVRITDKNHLIVQRRKVA